MSVWTIVLAGGSGDRFGGHKQFETLGDRRLVDWPVATARPFSDGVVVVLPAHHPWDGAAVEAAVAGGSTHADSVRAGLAAVPTEAEVVVLATAVHPLAGPALFRAVIAAVRSGAAAAAPAIASADAIKRAAAGRVTESIDKSDLHIVQAPSAYQASALREALANGAQAPEELELIERRGAEVRLVPGDPANVHVATVRDLHLARRLLGS